MGDIFTIGQSGGENTIHNYGPQERQLSEELKQQLKNLVSGKEKEEYKMMAVSGDPEAFRYAQKIHKYLSELGVNISPIGTILRAGPPVIGIEFNPKRNHFIVGHNN